MDELTQPEVERDSERSLRRAITLMLVLGLLGLIGMAIVLVLVLGLSGERPAVTGDDVIPFVIMVCLAAVPSVAFIGCAYFLARYQAWAAVVGIVVTSLALLGSAINGLVGLVIALLAQISRDPPLVVWILPLISVTLAIVLIVLLVHLSRSFKEIRLAREEMVIYA